MRRQSIGGRKPSFGCPPERAPMRLVLLAGLAYGLMSLITYAVYAVDKAAARQGRRRVPERMLHIFALLGGWPGALLAQQHLRHKSSKTRFLALFWLTVLIHMAVVVLLVSLQDNHWLR